MIKRIPFIPLVLFLLSSCTPTYYLPNNVNTPLHQEKGELQVTGFGGAATEFNLAGVNAAYSITENTGAMINTCAIFAEPFHGEITTTDKNYSPHNRSFMAEGGYGYFKPFGPLNAFVFESYAGYGVYSNNRAINDESSVSYLIHRPFVQPALGFRNKYVEISGGIRFTMLNFTNDKRTDAFVSNEFQNNTFEDWMEKSTFTWEPFFSLAAGTQHVKLQIQFINIPQILLFGIHPESGYFENTGNISLGLQIRL